MNAISSLGVHTSCVHKHHATAAKELHKLTEARPNDEHNLRQE